VSDGPGRILFLGAATSPVRAYLEELGEDVKQTDSALDDDVFEGVGFLVSHGYRHIVRPHVVAAFPRRAVILHISYLPFYRGADPNFWSFIDGTPKGVTVHLIDEGLDTGEIIAQEEVEFAAQVTLRESYEVLQAAMVDLFRRTWPTVRGGDFMSYPQREEGTSHRAAEFASIRERLPQGWDTPVSQLHGMAS
jgi:methionyl-tRNA formyltransferase